MAAIREITPVFQSLTNPLLIMGGERETILLIGFLSASTWIIGQDLVSLLIALTIWIVGVITARVMAKTDPSATKVFLKSLRYRDFYSAREKLITPRIQREGPNRLLQYHL